MYRGGISLGEVKARPGCVWIIDRLNKYSLLFLQFPTTNMFHIFMSAEPQFTCTVEIQTDILFIPVPREMYNFLFCGKMGKRCLNFDDGFQVFLWKNLAYLLCSNDPLHAGQIPL